MPRRDNYISPVILSGKVASVPDGNFLLPICTNKARLIAMSDALIQGGLENHRRRIGDHNIDFLQALSAINRPYRNACGINIQYPIQIDPPALPLGVCVGPDCIFIDKRKYPGDVNIITDYCVQVRDICQPEEYDMSSHDTETPATGTASAERLQELAQDLLAVTSQQQVQQTELSQLRDNYNNQRGALVDLQNEVEQHRQDAEAERVSKIGMMQWSARPRTSPGWTALDGSIYTRADYPTFWDQAPDEWRDTANQQVVLPSNIYATPHGPAELGTDVGAFSDGVVQPFWMKNTAGTGYSRSQRIRARLYIYVGLPGD